MGATKSSGPTSGSTSAQPFAHLSPRVRHISQSTIRKKWKPLPQSSQEKVRAILLSLKTKRAASGRIPAIGTRARSERKTKTKSKNDVRDEEYEKVVEEVTEKLLSRLPRMPFPLTSNSNSNSSHSSSSATTTDESFSFEATLDRISSLQSTLSMHQTSSHLLRNQLKHEQRGLKRDKSELARLEDAWKSSQALRRKQERGLHPLARAIDHEDDGGRDSDGEDEDRETRRERIEKMNAVAGIRALATNRLPLSLEAQTSPDLDPDIKPLLEQLRNHLNSMQNNTASMQPVLEAMSEAQVALDLFAAARFDEQTRRKLYGLDTW